MISLLDKYHSTESANEKYQLIRETYTDFGYHEMPPSCLGIALTTTFLSLAKIVNPNFFSDLTDQITDIYLARADRDNKSFENGLFEDLKAKLPPGPPPTDLISALMRAPGMETITLDPTKRSLKMVMKDAKTGSSTTYDVNTFPFPT